MFTESFMVRAFLAALFLSPLCALLGVFVTARKMAFFSDTISHAALAGIALGFWWGLSDPTLPMMGFGLLVAAALLWLKEHTELLTDTLMALLLSGSVSLGILIMSLMQGDYRGEIHRVLFGDILAVGPRDVWISGILLVAIGAGVFLKLSPLALVTAQEELAAVCGIAVRRQNYFFVVVLTLTVAMTIQLLGILLVTALLVIPAATARNLSRNLRQQIVLSLVVGIMGGLPGIVISYHLDVPSGPAIVLTCILLFLLSLVMRGWNQEKVEIQKGNETTYAFAPPEAGEVKRVN
jgi:zinc transport system permease protein